MKNMKIQFRAANKSIFDIRQKPIPSSQMIPKWWKDIPKTTLNEKFTLSPYPNLTSKKCFPLLDGITAGYIMPLWADIHVQQYDNYPGISWTVADDVFDMWNPLQVSTYEIPEGYSKSVFKYKHGWVIETPKNYSCLITHPIGYPNLPFRTLTGIVDTDMYKGFANSPLVIKNGFEGIIEKGTPMFQIIPIKRDHWKLETDFLEGEEFYTRSEILRTTMVSSYGRFFRKNKKYE